MEHLVLFDIDCTLIDGHGAGKRAVLRALREVYGAEGDLGDYSFHGRTDPGIVRDLAALWTTTERPDGDGDAECDRGTARGLSRTLPRTVARGTRGGIGRGPARRAPAGHSPRRGPSCRARSSDGQRRGGSAAQAGLHRAPAALQGRRLRLRLTRQAGAPGRRRQARGGADEQTVHRQGDRHHRRYAGRRHLRRTPRRQGDRRGDRPLLRAGTGGVRARISSTRTSATGAACTRRSSPEGAQGAKRRGGGLS